MSLAETPAPTQASLGLDGLFERVSDAILVADAAGRIVLWNPAAERLFGYIAADVAGRDIGLLASTELAELLAAPESGPLEIAVASSAGATLTVEAAVSRVTGRDGDDYSLCVLRDVTATRGYERFMREMSVASAAGENPDQSWFETVTAFLGRSLDMDMVVLGELSGSRPDVIQTLSLFQNGELQPNRVLPLAASGLAGLAGRELTTVSGLAAASPRAAAILGLEADGAAGIGLFDRQGRQLGLAAVLSSRPLSDPALVKSVLGLITARATAEIEKARAEAVLLEHSRRLALTAAVTEAIAHGGPLREVLQTCADIVVEHLDLALARVWTHDETRSTLEVQASAGLTQVRGEDDRPGAGLYPIGLIAAERKPHLSNDVLDDPRFSNREWVRAEGMVAFAGYPLLVDDRLVGVLAMFSRKPMAEATLDELSSVSEVFAQLIERRRTETALGRVSSRYELILNAAGEGIYGLDMEGRVTFINPSAASILGFEADELVGRSIHHLIHHSRPDGSPYPEAECQATAVLRDAQPSSVDDEVFWTKDGRAIPIHYRTTPVFEGGELAGGVVTFSDITEQRSAREELDRRNEDLERSNAELERFAYVASHDLQEPLRAVVSYLQLLERRYAGQLDERADKYINYAVDGSRRMQQLINDLLAYSRVGRAQQPLRPTSMERVVDGALANLRQAIEDAGVEIVREPLPEVLGDPMQMGQLMQNLIGNAIKFRSADPPWVRISAERRARDWHFKVKDNGIGIDPTFNERIFIVFQRLHGRQQYAGTGIGLAICKKIVERHGGEIWVESAVDQGSVFNFTLPLEAA